jgi:hypothetical protein
MFTGQMVFRDQEFRDAPNGHILRKRLKSALTTAMANFVQPLSLIEAGTVFCNSYYISIHAEVQWKDVPWATRLQPAIQYVTTTLCVSGAVRVFSLRKLVVVYADAFATLKLKLKYKNAANAYWRNQQDKKTPSQIAKEVDRQSKVCNNLSRSFSIVLNRGQKERLPGERRMRWVMLPSGNQCLLCRD